MAIRDRARFRGWASPTPSAAVHRIAAARGIGEAMPVLKQARRDLAYLIPAVVTGLASFTVLVSGLAAGAGTLAIAAGVPLLGWVLGVARMFVGLERRRIRALTGRELPPPCYRQAAGSGLGRLRILLTDPQLWRDALHGLLAMPLAAFTAGVTVTWVWFAAMLMHNSLYGSGKPQAISIDGMTFSGYFPAAAVGLLLGLAFLVTLPPVLRTL